MSDELRWLREMRQRREAHHPETVHQVVLELVTDNLWAAQLQAMAKVLEVDPNQLLHRYLVQGLEQDLDRMP